MRNIRVTIGSVAVRQTTGAPHDPIALRRSLEASLTRDIADREIPVQARDAHVLQSKAPAPNAASNIGTAISHAVLRALGKSR